MDADRRFRRGHVRHDHADLDDVPAHDAERVRERADRGPQRVRQRADRDAERIRACADGDQLGARAHRSSGSRPSTRSTATSSASTAADRAVSLPPRTRAQAISSSEITIFFMCISAWICSGRCCRRSSPAGTTCQLTPNRSLHPAARLRLRHRGERLPVAVDLFLVGALDHEGDCLVEGELRTPVEAAESRSVQSELPVDDLPGHALEVLAEVLIRIVGHAVSIDEFGNTET